MGYFATEEAIRLGAELKLGGNAQLVFLYMAHKCRDSDDSAIKPRTYFGGHVRLAIALGFVAPDNASERALRAVKRAVKELVDKGAIKRLSYGRAGNNATYELLVPSKPDSKTATVRSIRPSRPTMTTERIEEADGDEESEWGATAAF